MASKLAARKDAKWRIVFLAPDFCFTPGVPSPVPYPVTSDLGNSKNVIKSVRLNKKPAFVFDASKSPLTLGDQAGVNKGVVSRTVGKDCWPIMHSPDTRIGHKYVVRNGDLFYMNGNFNKPPGGNLTKKERWEERKRLIEQGKQSSDPKVRAAAERLERNNVAVEKARLAQHIYDPSKPAPEGWTDISKNDAALAKYGLNKNDLTVPGTDFRAGVYEPQPGVFGNDMSPSVVFRGTQSGRDWQDNIAQGLNRHSSYYERAVSIGNRVGQSGTSVDMVGHSLGGGLASAASRASGAPGWTFNAAGLHPSTVTRYGGTAKAPATENITAYQIARELLTGVQEQGPLATLAAAGVGALFGGLPGAIIGGLAKIGLSALMPDAVGNKFELPGSGHPLKRHGIEQSIDGIEGQKEEDIAILKGAT